MKHITKTIWLLSLISMFTDIAGEMLYPVMPIYLKEIGFSIVMIGILEGLAEATAGFSKGYFGKKSDLTGKRVPFVQFGYLLSAISKPMMALFIHPVWIFMSRTMDRFGKGIRTGARDAMLSDEATPETKGKIFGFHRGLDTLGAVIGPSLAMIYLYYYPTDYKTLFIIAIVPGLSAVAATSLLKDKARDTIPDKTDQTIFSFLSYWNQSPQQYRMLIIGLMGFALINSSDVFLLLKAKEAGLSDTGTIGIYIFYNLIYAVFALPLGILSDRIGFKKMFIGGLIMFCLVYLGTAFATDLSLFVVIFALYGIYAAATEGISKAWISNISDKKDIATAIGTYSAFQSICTMIASSLAGFIWYTFGSFVLFMGVALTMVIVIGYFIIYIPISTKTSQS